MALTCSSFLAVSIARLTKPSSLSVMIPSIGRMTTLSLAYSLCEIEFLLHTHRAVAQKAGTGEEEDDIRGGTSRRIMNRKSERNSLPQKPRRGGGGGG